MWFLTWGGETKDQLFHTAAKEHPDNVFFTTTGKTCAKEIPYWLFKKQSKSVAHTLVLSNFHEHGTWKEPRARHERNVIGKVRYFVTPLLTQVLNKCVDGEFFQTAWKLLKYYRCTKLGAWKILWTFHQNYFCPFFAKVLKSWLRKRSQLI